MAFWGVEVKPGKPITHYCENARGRLRISQATLGIGESTSKIIVQCNVGKRSPVLLCALLPNKTESCHLDLEFEEPDDVVFSVIGPRSVYLTGYYVQKIRQSNTRSDTESYGMDIENTHTEGSSYGGDDEKYDDSFINDDAELQFSPRSPVNNEGTDDETPENDKPKDKKGHGGQHRKKYCVIESDSDASTHEGEDDDDDKIAMETTTMSDDGEKDDSVYRIEPKQKVDCLDTNGEVEGAKPKKKRKQRSKKEDKTCNNQTDNANMDIGENSEDGQKSKKIRNKLGMDGINTEGTIKKCHNVVKDDEKSEEGSQHVDNLTRLAEICTEEIGSESRDIAKEDESVQVLPHDDSVKEDLPAQTGEYQDHLIDKYPKRPRLINAALISERILLNGLIIEELAPWTTGWKSKPSLVKIYYAAMLKDTGACMRVGDKRRLIIPPSMGFGDQGIGEDVPPNAWLVYEIELYGSGRAGSGLGENFTNFLWKCF
ncbi:peptidyl-prolyl cis-trans isomerase fkbp43 [Phtheirospermum japonicum]|uniref:peptidylprolyl isomerase n=1 Tax=Phtheirospermum japonicum TaxID=374723 RepID=A0A830BE59_9LAMI|nr:peptidyl-prolyl cis-trans isomerase fkbp43 [Phtheirospermum japonicum]